MVALGTFAFMDVTGVLPPATAPRIERIENPALVPATLDIPNQPDVVSLTYRGWFAATQALAIKAIAGATLSATDQNGTTATVKVMRQPLPVEVPALSGDIPGYWVEVTVEVLPWA